MDDEDIFELRRLLLGDWLSESRLSKQDFAAKIGVSPTYLTRLLSEPDKNGHKKLDTALVRRIEVSLERDGQMLNPQRREKRELSTSEEVGMPRKGGHTTTVNHTTDEVKQRSILPLVPMDRVDLMLLQNDDPMVLGLGTYAVEDGGAPFDLAVDKVLVLERDVKDTIALKGHVAVFRPTRGRMVRPTNRPVVMRSDRGTFHLVSYDSMAAMPSAELVAVCVHCYQPMDEDPFI